MKKVKSIILFTVIGFQSFLLGDVTSSITSLVGRNAEGYLAPIGTMMGTGMNSGFYRKASPHKILGFDLTLDIGYELANPLAYGCFSGSGTSKTYHEGTEEAKCTGNKTWTTGVPTDISLSFPGDNKFRKLIGARIRVLFIDAYLDYNMGTSNALNAGFGITFR
ncbi:MAG: hypothetical protein QGF36_02320 [Candidatus Marinimicrobia bacterium]|nr:hypothetical protein [Candidatus Neomarinimicrobiota bacterium]